MMIKVLIFSFSLFLGASFVGSASAVDGVREINQTCADNTGCFSGDAAGLPVKITAAGSYRLTSNLILPDENTTGIDVSTSDVDIDMNGFAIIRSGCEGATTNCTPASGAGSGIITMNSLHSGISVRNGTITGMGYIGLKLGRLAEATNLRVRWSRLYGVEVGLGSRVSNVMTYQNGVYGIKAGTGATVANSVAYDNGLTGIYVEAGSTVSGNTAYDNFGPGISAAGGATISGNTAYENDTSGINASAGSMVTGNTASNNTGYGLQLSGDTGYSNNVMKGNSLAAVSGGIEFGENVCDEDTTCP